MVYAAGRPLWMISLTWWENPRQFDPTPVLRWSPTVHRRIEAARDRIMQGVGSNEPLIREDWTGLRLTVQWRKPLSIEEINRMAPTPEVRARPGRA